jgi:regulator of sirC expression with transglutaminase-like and TPR domain
VNFPGHFLCRIPGEDGPVIVDCFDGGRCHTLAGLRAEHPDLGPEQRAALEGMASPAVILQRVLLNLSSAFAGLKRDEDARLAADLRETVS